MTGAAERSVYSGYWRRKQLKQTTPHFENVRWWPAEGFSDIENIYWRELQNCKSILDVGAGDLSTMRKFVREGYRGEYHTMDIGGEFEYTYPRMESINRLYDGILCLDVIEHLPLESGLHLIQRMLSLLNASGTLIIQTPNAKCIRHPSSWDMTHVHTYSVSDLWVYLTSQGTTTKGYRVTFTDPRAGIWNILRSVMGRVIATQFLGCDYADNIALISKRG